MDIQYHMLSPEEIDKVSEQIAISYTSAYKGLMDAAYLDSIAVHDWSPVLKNSMCNGDTCIVATYDETIIGSTVFGTSNGEDGKYAEWHAFYLLPQYVGRGIGHLFYQEVEKEIIKQECQSCTLEVLSANKRAIRFYRSHGFEKTETFIVEENGMSLSCDKMVKSYKQI